MDGSTILTYLLLVFIISTALDVVWQSSRTRFATAHSAVWLLNSTSMAHETSPSVGPEDTIHGIYYAAYRRHELAEAIEPRLKEDSLDDFRKRLGFSEEDKRPQVDIKPIVSSNGESTKATCHNVLNAIVTELEGMRILSELSALFTNRLQVNYPFDFVTKQRQNQTADRTTNTAVLLSSRTPAQAFMLTRENNLSVLWLNRLRLSTQTT